MQRTHRSVVEEEEKEEGKAWQSVMESDGCATLDNSSYSSPMPAIGLYIAGATLVCFLLMLCDILNGIRQRKPWIPCRFFVLNSFTLTLLSIATKLPIDLTTSMHSAYDQLSKLCGTCLICISIGFFYPSVGNISESELFVNLASLTIMVITITVDISIQMTTGVIFFFKVEHVITLVSMFLLLGLTCATKADTSGPFVGSFQETLRDKPRNYIKTLLEKCYILGYMSNPQLVSCRHGKNAFVGMLCTICLVALSEAAIRAFHLERHEYLFCKEVSDYKWSIWAVLAIQFLTLIVGSLAIASRWIALASQILPPARWALGIFKRYKFLDVCQFILILYRNWELYFLGFMSFPRKIFQIFQLLQSIFDSVLLVTAMGAGFIDFFCNFVVRAARACLAWAMRKTGFCFGFLKWDDSVNHEIVASLRNEIENMTVQPFSNSLYSDYLLWKSKKDMQRFIKKHSASPTNSLFQFLGRSTSNSHQPVLLWRINNRSDKLLLLVCLVRMIDAILVPSARSGSLVSAFDEIFEIIVFIHGKTKPMLVFGNIKMNIAKDIWMSRSNNCHWFHIYFIKHLKNGGDTDDPSSSSGHARGIVQKSFILNQLVYRELSDIIKIINGNDLAPMKEDVNNRMEQLFVELLHWYIEQFPDVVFKSITEACIGNEFEENAKLCLKFVSKLGPLEVNWGSIGTNIMDFMMTDHPFGAPNQEVPDESDTNVSDCTNSFPTAQKEDREISEEV